MKKKSVVFGFVSVERTKVEVEKYNSPLTNDPEFIMQNIACCLKSGCIPQLLKSTACYPNSSDTNCFLPNWKQLSGYNTRMLILGMICPREPCPAKVTASTLPNTHLPEYNHSDFRKTVRQCGLCGLCIVISNSSKVIRVERIQPSPVKNHDAHGLVLFS